MVMQHFLSRYDFKLVDEHATSTLSWDTVLLPHPKLRMLVRERTV